MSLSAEFFSPLGREYCLYFYVLTVVSFMVVAISIVAGVYHIAQGRADIIGTVMGLLGPLLLYFNNRILYSMCVR